MPVSRVPGWLRPRAGRRTSRHYLRSRPLSERKAKLTRLLARAPAGIAFNEHTGEDPYWFSLARFGAPSCLIGHRVAVPARIGAGDAVASCRIDQNRGRAAIDAEGAHPAYVVARAPADP